MPSSFTRPLVLAFGSLAFAMAGHALVETARDALFLARLPPSRMPFVYVGIAAVAVVLTQLRAALKDLRGEAAVLFCAGVYGLWWIAALRSQADWVYYGLYVWSGAAITIVLIQVWAAIGAAFDIREAKKTFAQIGIGSAIGATVGSAAARAITELVPTEHLIAGGASCFVVSAAFVHMLQRRTSAGTKAHEAPPLPSSRARRAERPYVRGIVVLTLLSALTLTVVDYLFKSVAYAEVPKDQLGAFFATTNTALNAISLVVQFGLVSRILRKLGVRSAIVVFPLLLGVTDVAVLAGLGFSGAIALKIVDGGLRYSLFRTVSEILFVPLGAAVRVRTKSMAETVGQRGGQALASALVLTIIAVSDPTPRVWGVVVAVLLAGWLGVAFTMRDRYAEVFRATLLDQQIARDAALPNVDLDSLESLFRAFNSPDERRVAATIDLLRARGRSDLVPTLVAYHPSPTVALRALEVFDETDRPDIENVLGHLLKNADSSVRARALTIGLGRGLFADRIEALLEDDDALVRLTALAALDADDALERCRALVREGDVAERVALAHALATSRHEQRSSMLQQLFDVGPIVVRRAVVESMRIDPTEEHLPVFLRSLAERSLREDARIALVALGEVAFQRLLAVLADENVPLDVRRHVPRTLTRFARDDVGKHLCRYLGATKDWTLDYKVLRALGGLHNVDPDHEIDVAEVRAALERTLVRGRDLGRWLATLRAGSSQQRGMRILVDIIRDRRRRLVEQAFRLLELQRPGLGFQEMHYALTQRNEGPRVAAEELLESVLPNEQLVRLRRMLKEVEPRKGDAEEVDRVMTAIVAWSADLGPLVDEIREEERS